MFKFKEKTKKSGKKKGQKEPTYPTWAWTEDGCGKGEFDIEVTAVQTEGLQNDTAAQTFTENTFLVRRKHFIRNLMFISMEMPQIPRRPC